MGIALHTDEILQRCMYDLVLNEIVIIFTAKINLIMFALISTGISEINMRICDELLNFFVSVYL